MAHCNQARLRRQQAEQDRQILANRVHLLEIEAKKAQKMINETKRRTAQLRKQKQARADDRFAKAEKKALRAPRSTSKVQCVCEVGTAWTD